MSYRAQYAVWGALFGLLFPVGAHVIGFLEHGLPLSWAGIVELHAGNSLHFIIDSAPLFLGLFASFAGKREDRNHRYAGTLEVLVADRTADLRQALVAAQAADRAKSEFLTNTSHEIRTPMNGILGFAELMSETPLTNEQGEFLATIQQSGESLLALLEDILDLSRIESGRFELDEVDVDLEVLVHDVGRLIRSRLESRAVELIVDCSEEVPARVTGDPIRLRQIVMNLAGNAAKFTEQGVITLRVRGGGRGADGEGAIEIQVCDSGIGIPADQQDRIFERFSQADGGRTRKKGGSGLGLTITRHLAERMGGSIGLQSEPGQGSCFRVVLPLPVVPVSDPQLRRHRESTLEGVQVLVVDDLPEARIVTTRFCRRLGLQPREAPGTEAALEILRETGSTIRLVVSDILMPESDGIELARAIRTLPAGEEYQLLAVSSWVGSGAAQACRAAGFDAFLAKPLGFFAFRNSLRSLFGIESGAHPRDGFPGLDDESMAGSESVYILLAEDNPVNIVLVQTLLSKMGVRVSVAANGAEAIEMARHGDFDMILMDVQMPVMDGLEGTRQLREEGNDVPVIALTAGAMKGDREICVESGMNDYLTKPVNRAALLATLREYGGVS